MVKKIISCFLALLSASIGASAADPNEKWNAQIPHIWLWAWDRPEDLRFLKPEDAGVAFFVLGIHIGEKDTSLRPRIAPLRLPKGVSRIAVVRIEMEPVSVSESRLRGIISAIRSYALVPDIQGLQIDFDANRSQRPFYRRLLEHMKNDSSIRIPISITALASWCMGDPWIQDLPVRGTVAMLFQMGNGTEEALSWLRKERALIKSRTWTLAWGVSTDQPLPVNPPKEAVVFLFHSRSWNSEAFKFALHMVGR